MWAPAPHGLAITPDGSRVLVAGFGTDQVEAIDTNTNQVVWKVPVAQPHNLAITADGQTAYAASQKVGSQALAIIDIPSGSETGSSVPLDHTPRALNVSPDGQEVFFTEAGVDALLVLDRASNQIVTQIPTGASPHHPLGDGLIDGHRAPLLACESGSGLTETAFGDVQPPPESFSVGRKWDGPDCYAQRACCFRQADSAPGLCHRERTGETLDATRGGKVVSGLPSQTDALGERRPCPPGVALGKRLLCKEVQRPDDASTDAQLAAELDALLQPFARGGVVTSCRSEPPSMHEVRIVPHPGPAACNEE
jgi:YVTN family beta-propeller protein